MKLHDHERLDGKKPVRRSASAAHEPHFIANGSLDRASSEPLALLLEHCDLETIPQLLPSHEALLIRYVQEHALERAASIVGARPKIINFQAVDYCNSRCCMCNVWKAPKMEYAGIGHVIQVLSDPFFQAVEHVGVTGGEPTLRRDLFELYRAFADALPNLNGASFITHGFLTERAWGNYSRVAEYYAAKGLSFSGMVSLDGLGELHDRVRGYPGGFDKAVATLFGLRQRGVTATACCTIVKENVYGVNDLLGWAQANRVKIKFRLAEFINRLANSDRADQIRNFTPQEVRHLSAFFHELAQTYETESDQCHVYHSILAMLAGRPRQIGCTYHNLQMVSVDSQLGYSFCSVRGVRHEPCASICESIAENQDEALAIRNQECSSCIHDFPGPAEGVQRWLRDVDGEYSQMIYGNDQVMSLRAVSSAAVPVNLRTCRHMLLIGWYGTETAGDIAILGGITQEFRRQNPALKFTVLSSHPEYSRVSMGDLDFVRQSSLRICAMDGFQAYQAIRECDAVCVAGGPLMDLEDTSKLLAICRMFKHAGKPVIIEGCGVGPLNVEKYRNNVLALVQLADRISVRSQGSADHLKELGVTRPVQVRPDPATTYIEALDMRWRGADSRMIRCFLRALPSEYPQATTREQADEVILSFLRKLLSAYPDHCVELWPMHYFHVGNDDREFARWLTDTLDNPRLTYQHQPQTPEGILESMTGAAFCVCMRFHSVLFASALGVPFVAVDYTGGGKTAHLLNELHQADRLFSFDSLTRLTPDTLCALFEKPYDSRASTLKPITAVQINTSDVQGGAAKAAYSLHRALQSQGSLGQYLVHSRLSQDSSVVECGSNDRRGPGAFYAEAIHAALVKTAPTDPYFSWPILGCDVSSHPAVVAADVLHLHWVSHFQSLQSLVALARTGKPLVFTMHDQWLMTGGCHYPQACEQFLTDCAACPLCIDDGPAFTGRVFQQKREFVQTYKPTVICPSRWMAERAKESPVLKDCPIKVVPNCVEIQKFKPIPKAEARHRLGVPVGGFYILFGASDCGDHRKGFDVLARALAVGLNDPEFAKAVREGIVKLICFGALHPAIAESGFPVIALGRLANEEQLSVAYSSADVTVVPSRVDNLPNTILESFSCATPVIGADVGGIPELVLVGRTGFLFEVGNAAELAARLSAAFKERSRLCLLGRTCRELAVKEYSPAVQAKRMSEIYAALVAGAAPNACKTTDQKLERSDTVLAIDADTAISDRILLRGLQYVLDDVIKKAGGQLLLPPKGGGERFELAGGFYQPEGDFRWMSNAAIIRVARWALEMPMSLCFDLKCGKGEWYPEFPLRCEIHLNGRPWASVRFEQDYQCHHVDLPLEAASMDCLVELKSDQYFVPANVNGDPRVLALQVRNLVLYADNTREGGNRSLHFVSLDAHGMRIAGPAVPVASGETQSNHRQSPPDEMTTMNSTHNDSSATNYGRPLLVPFNGQTRNPIDQSQAQLPIPLGRTAPSVSAAASRFMEVANAHYVRGDVKSCCAALEWALEVDPETADLRATLGSVQFQLGQLAEARHHFERAVQLNHNCPLLHVQLATTCLKLDDVDGFEKALRHAISLDPECPEALSLLADLNFQSGRHAEASRLYDRLLVRKPNEVALLLAQAKCRYHLGEPALAGQLYEQVTAIEPGNAIAMEALEILRNKSNGQTKPSNGAPAFMNGASIHSVAAPSPPGTPSLLARQAILAECRNGAFAPSRPALQEEAARNQEEVNWWKKFIFEHFDGNREVSERKFIERFRGECTSRWKYVCEELKLDVNCCMEGAVLDVGNGPCGLINFIPARIKVGVDPNNELYQQNGILYNVHNDVLLLPARAEAIPLLDSTFDFITCVNVLDHTNDPAAILAEVYRLLKPSGLFWLSVDTRKPEETQLVHPHAISGEICLEWARPLICIAQRQDRRAYDDHPTNKRFEGWFQKQG